MTVKAMDMEPDLRSRVVALEHQCAALDRRVTATEAWQRQADIMNARKDEQFKGMDDRFGRIELDLQKINGTLAKIMWLIIGGIITGLVVFMMGGGFKLP